MCQQCKYYKMSEARYLDAVCMGDAPYRGPCAGRDLRVYCIVFAGWPSALARDVGSCRLYESHIYRFEISR